LNFLYIKYQLKTKSKNKMPEQYFLNGLQRFAKKHKFILFFNIINLVTYIYIYIYIYYNK